MIDWKEGARFPIDSDMSELRAFLLQQNIKHLFTDEGLEQVLWMRDAEDIALLTNFLEKYQKGEIHTRRSAHLDIFKQLDIVEFAAISPITSLVLFVGFIGYLVGGVFQSIEIFKHISYLPYKDLANNYEFWRVFTPAFVHFSVAHYVFNAIWLYIFGRKLEVFLGGKRYIVLLLISAIAANEAQFAMTYSNLFGGLSGVVYGLLGFIAVGKLVYKEPLMNLPNNMIVIFLLMMLLGFLGALDWATSGGVANWAHLGGFLGGALYSLVYFLFNKQVKLNE